MTEPTNAELAERLVAIARKNLRYYIGIAAFKCEAERTAARNCLDVIEEHISGLDDLVAVLRSAFDAASRLRSDPPVDEQDRTCAEIAPVRARALEEALLASSPDDYWQPIVAEVEAAGVQVRHARFTNHQAAHLLAWAQIARASAIRALGKAPS